jgi:hypothetical protein
MYGVEDFVTTQIKPYVLPKTWQMGKGVSKIVQKFLDVIYGWPLIRGLKLKRLFKICVVFKIHDQMTEILIKKTWIIKKC